MKTFKNLLCLTAFVFCSNFALAQEEEPRAERYENLEWYVVHYIKFEDGKAADAKKIIEDYFKPSAEDVGQQNPVLELDLLFSEWDHIVVFPLEEGLESFEWKTSPAEVEWMTAFEKRAGSPEKAKELGENFDSFIKESKSILARKTD